MVKWLPNATAMNVSFTRLTIVEANSIGITYNIRYSPSPLAKRQSEMKMATVKENENTAMISGLDPYQNYHVVVDATNSHGTKSSPSHLLPAGYKLRPYKRQVRFMLPHLLLVALLLPTYLLESMSVLFFHSALSRDQEDTGSGGIVAGVVAVTFIILAVIILVVSFLLLWRKRYRIQNSFARYFTMCLTPSYRSFGKAMDIPLFSGKRKLYTVRPIKASEMIELDNPTPHPVSVQSEHSFATAKPESKSLS